MQRYIQFLLDCGAQILCLAQTLTMFSERHKHGVVGVLLDLGGGPRAVVAAVDHGEAGQVRVLRLVAAAIVAVVLEREVAVAAALPPPSVASAAAAAAAHRPQQVVVDVNVVRQLLQGEL